MIKRAKLFVAVLLLLLSGCAGKPEELKLGRMLWPIPPDEPRLEFKGVYSSEKDLEEKTRKSKALEFIAGDPPQALFKTPMGIASDNKGTVYIADLHDRNVRVYDFNKRIVEYFLPNSPFGQPIDVKVDREGTGNIFVSDIGRNSILVFSPDRQPLFSFGKEHGKKLTYMAINNRLGRIYVSDGMEHQIVVFDLQGNHLFNFGRGDMYGPRGLAIDAENNVYVTDGLMARIRIYDAEGKSIRYFGGRGDEPYAFDSPRGIAVDPDGNVYVADTKKSYFTVFSKEGALLTVVGAEQPGSGMNQFLSPGLIDIDPSGRVFITDPLNHRFVYWQYLTEEYKKQYPVTPEDTEQIERFRKELEKKVEELRKDKAGDAKKP